MGMIDEVSGKSENYEEMLRQATKYPAIEKFLDPVDGWKGLYRLDGDIVRTFRVEEVERKQGEMLAQQNCENEQ